MFDLGEMLPWAKPAFSQALQKQEVTSSPVFHQDKDAPASQMLFRKKPRSQWLIAAITFVYPDE